MPRLIVLVSRPDHLSFEEGEAWLRRQASAVAHAAGAEHARLSRLEPASSRWGHDWDWLIELDLAGPDEASRMVGREECADLLADLRLLGMQPAVTVATDSGELRP